MLDLQQHKEFIWTYMLTYGEVRYRKIDNVPILPFANIEMEPGKKVEDYKTDELKKTLYDCSTLLDIYHFISDIYKDFYFMEICSLLHEESDKEIYSALLKETFEVLGISETISKKNYEYLIVFASSEVQSYIKDQLRTV